MQNLYDWKRCWYKRGRDLPLENGFLKPMDLKYVQDTDVVFTFDKISDKPCLILLGDAGLGKTTALSQIVTDLEQKPNREIDFLNFDLRLISSDSKLDSIIFQHPTFVKWINGNHKLCLFLDSLDEGLLHIGLLGDLLLEKLKVLDISRLQLRIACRTGVFPSELEDELLEIWGKENFEILELAPLTAKDVVTACEKCNINSKEFFYIIYNKQIESLARSPVTLDMLLRMYNENNNDIPLSKLRIYEEGCRILCKEVNRKRSQNKSLSGNVPTDKRMKIAMLLGAITLFCNKGLIVNRRAEDNELSIDEFISVSYDKFQYNMNDIYEVLGSSLFTEKGQNEYTWAHLSYAEFFAAKFAQNNKFSTEQILSLILQSEDNNNRVIPQLHYTTAWIASFNDEVFYHIIERDPDVLCLSDVAQMDDRRRKLLVDSLLDRYNICNEYFRNGNQSFYKNLKHESLSSQLTTFIRDKNKTDFSKRIVLHIAYECRLSEMAPEILNLVKKCYYSGLAWDALNTYFHICDDDKKKESLELLEHVPETLAELIFENLYPCYISLDGIYNYLINNRFTSDHFYGHVVSILKLLTVNDLAILINKFFVNLNDAEKNISYNCVIDILLIHSWASLSEDKIYKEWINLAMKRLVIIGTPITQTSFVNSFEVDFTDNFKSNFTRRICLIKEIWKSDNEFDIIKIINSKLEIIGRDDISNILAYIENEVDKPFNEWLFLLLLKIFEPNKAKESMYYEQVFIKLNDIKTKLYKIPQIKEDVNKTKLECDKKCYNLKNTQLFGDAPDKAKLTDILKDIKQDVVKYWPDLIKNIYEKLYFLMNYSNYGITDSRGWKLLSESERVICSEAAHEFLLMFEKENYIIDSFGRNLRPILSAIELVWETGDDKNITWSSQMWEKMFDYIINPNASGYRFEKVYFKLAYIYAPDKVIRLLLDELTNKRQLGSQYSSRNIAEKRAKICGDAFLISTIKQTLNTKRIALTSRGDLYKLIIDIDYKNEEYVSNVINGRFNDISSYKYALEAGCSLMDKAHDGGRNIITTIIKSSNQNDINFMILLIIRYSQERREYTFLKLWGMEDLVFLYLFIHNNQEKLTKYLSNKYNEWKMLLLREFEEKKDILSRTNLYNLYNNVPDCELIQASWEKIRMTYFRETWTPPDINTIIEMLDNLKTKPITNGRQLMDVVRDTLLIFEKEMIKSENPITDLLWNKYDDIRLPKDEESLSNLLKTFIDKDLGERGVIVNREVQVFHKQGGIPGERIDIKVDLPHYGIISKSVKLYIEIKGCWNPGLETSMKTQLVERYMLNRDCIHGIYLIGWYNCPQWSLNKDTRIPPKYSYAEAKKKFEEQSLLLSKEYNVYVNAIVLDLSLK